MVTLVDDDEGKVGNLEVAPGEGVQQHLVAGCQNTREWGIRFLERSGLNHNLADRFRENKKFKVVFE